MIHNIKDTFNHKGHFVPDPEPLKIAKAKRILRWFFTAVYNAKVIGGRKDRWVVGNLEVDKETLIEMAREKI